MSADGQIVVVTGSNSGIGQATAAGYLSGGATVFGLDIAETQPVPGNGDWSERWVPLRVDVSDASDIEQAFETVRSRGGVPDVLVTSAAVGYQEPFLEISEESWDRVIGINVTGTMLCVRAALTGMVERGSGSIVVLSSIAGRTKSVANGAHYTVSKYGLIGLVRHLAAELAGTGVRINCVAPGPTNTPILNDNSTEEERKAILEKTPLHRIAEPEDIASVISFLASDRARHVHGAIFDVNGGMY
jgi:NAD(P)-dependent dehydrogenase (short-subunit alcohol dehydrogenase family)